MLLYFIYRKDEYLLGSSENENMTLFVRNDGNTTYQSCARVRIVGAQVIYSKYL